MSDFSKKPKWESLLLPEIFTHILTSLPIQSIITCTSVCKTWKSFIQNPSFISDHLRHSTTKYDHPLLLFRLCSRRLADAVTKQTRIGNGEKELYALHWDDNQDFNEYTRFEDDESPFRFRCQSRSGIFRVVGTCNGLVCLADDKYNYRYVRNFFVWNPCIRKFIKLPEPFATFGTGGVGFGFDPKTNDYKVVSIVTSDEKAQLGKSPLMFQVYSLATNDWRMVTTLSPTDLFNYNSPQAFVNGALHWLASRIVANEILHFVMVLHLGGDVFDEFVLPKHPHNSNNNKIQFWFNRSILAYGDSIAVFQVELITNRVDILLMKEYGVASSWTKICIKMFLPKEVGFTRSGEVIMEFHEGRLVLQDLETQKIKDLRITGYGYTFVDSYVESLVLLDKPNLADTY